MSYIDLERRSRPVALGGVVLLHVAIGYAFISGLAISIIDKVPTITRVIEIADDPVPPPAVPPPPQPKTKSDRPQVETPIVPTYVGSVETLTTEPRTYPPFVETPVAPEPPQPPRISRARSPLPVASRGGWVTTDDYPAAALRSEVQGVVGIDVTIGADGRVTACSVTSSSGSDVLDQATCRLYARRARFQPALGEDGQVTVGHYADRIRWTIPQ